MGTQSDGEPLKALEQESTLSRASEDEEPHGPEARTREPSLEVVMESLQEAKRPGHGLWL